MGFDKLNHQGFDEPNHRGPGKLNPAFKPPVLGMCTLLRYPIEVGDVSERPKVQHSKCCLV